VSCERHSGKNEGKRSAGDCKTDGEELELIADFLKRNAQRLRDDLADTLV